VDPFDVSLSFSDEMMVASTRNLTPADLAQEATLNAEDRVVAALVYGSAYPDEITETTGLARGTVKNKITALKKAGRVETTGEIRNQMEQVRLVAPRHRPIKESAASATPETITVAGLFANPPDWLVTQLEVYRKNPARHKKPLCAAVADVVLGDRVSFGVSRPLPCIVLRTRSTDVEDSFPGHYFNATNQRSRLR
jgi:hypothetical protein